MIANHIYMHNILYKSKKYQFILFISLIVYFFGFFVPSIPETKSFLKFFSIEEYHSIFYELFILNNQVEFIWKFILFLSLMIYPIANILPLLYLTFKEKINPHKIYFIYLLGKTASVNIIFSMVATSVITYFSSNELKFNFSLIFIFIPYILHFNIANKYTRKSIIINDGTLKYKIISSIYKVTKYIAAAIGIVTVISIIIMYNESKNASIEKNNSENMAESTETVKRDSYSECYRKGMSYYRSIGSYPTLSTGEKTEHYIRYCCTKNNNQFFYME